MEIREIPKSALTFNAGVCEFGDNGDNATTAPFRMTARTGDPINHFYWGNVVHDMSGLRLNKPRIGIDYNHSPDEVLGWANKFDVATGDLVASGTIQSTKDGDRASEVIARGKGGQPYEASIFFGDDIVCQELGDGESADVNGRTISGKALIIRQWSLRGIAVCPYGADAGTSTTFKADDKIKVRFMSKEQNENEKAEEVAATNADAPVEADNKLGDTPDAEAQAVTVEVAASAVEADDDVEAEAATPAVEPSEAHETPVASSVQATEQFALYTPLEMAAISLEVDQLREENAKLTKRLKALGSLGEEKPVAFSVAPEVDASEKDKPNAKVYNQLKKSGYSEATARFASSLKLPKG